MPEQTDQDTKKISHLRIVKEELKGRQQPFVGVDCAARAGREFQRVRQIENSKAMNMLNA
jgi:hypothetical protein